MDQNELSQHLEALRKALEPLSDLSQLTKTSLAQPEAPKVAAPAPKAAPLSGTSSNGEYRPALGDPELIRALLESGLTSTPLRAPSFARERPPSEPVEMVEEETEFSRQTPTSLEVELKDNSRPLKHGRSISPILRERPPRDSS